MDLMDYRRKIIASSPHLSHAEGAVATFSDGTDLPLKSLLVNIDLVQSGTGDPSPSNVRPISGWDAVRVTRTGKNLFGGYTLGQAIVNAISNSTYSHLGSDSNGNYVTVKASSVVQKAFTDGVIFKESTRYTLILRITRYQTGTNLNSNIKISYTDGTTTAVYFTTTSATEVVTIACTTTAGKTVKDIEGTWGGGEAKVFYEESGIFEGVLTTDQFEPYNGISITIQLGRTVYGGTLNVLTGELVVDMAIVDLGALNWVKSATRMLAQNLSPVAESINTSTIPNAACSIYKATKWGSVLSTDDSFSVISNQVLVYDSRFTDETAFKSAVTGQTLVYKLAQPLTYHLDPQTVRSLVGNNNIFADTGNVALDYWAHP